MLLVLFLVFFVSEAMGWFYSFCLLVGGRREMGCDLTPTLLLFLLPSLLPSLLACYTLTAAALHTCTLFLLSSLLIHPPTHPSTHPKKKGV